MPSKKFKIVHRIPNSNIVIDYWRPPSQGKYFHRFMTYLRIDAEESIKDICESNYTIYTSLFNKWYLITYYQVAEHRIVELREDETLTVHDEQTNSSFTVTAFDANYYAGSLMFLFQGSFGNVLYTGFFRPSSFDSIFQAPVLKSLVDKGEIDVAYIDNTYAADYCEFPSRKEIVSQIVTCLRERPKHKVAISGKRLGKEEILLDIAKALDEKVYVSEEKFVILSRLNLQNHFTTDKKKSRIYACDYIINPRECVKMQAREGPYIIILLTAFYHCNRPSADSDLHVPGLLIFPYSGHCSHSELVQFISFLRPRDIQPIIKFENSKMPHSIIPHSIRKLCYNPNKTQKFPDSKDSANSYKVENSAKFYSCGTDNSQNFYSCRSDICNDLNVSLNGNMMAACSSPEKPELVDNAINEFKCLNTVDDFLESVSNSNDVSEFSSDTSGSVLTMDTSTENGALNDALLNDFLYSPNGSNNVPFYTNVTDDNCANRNDIEMVSCDLRNHILNPNVQDPVQANQITVIPVSEIGTRFPSIENLSSAEEYSTACSPTSNGSAITTSCSILDNSVDTSNKSARSPGNEVHSTNIYVGNDIAENIISSTMTSPRPMEEMTKNKSGKCVVTLGEVNIDIRSDLDLQDMTEKDDTLTHVTVQHENEQLSKQQEPVKTFRNNSTQTDLNLDTLAHLEKLAESVVPRIEIRPATNEDVTNLIAKYMSTNKRGVFDTDKYYTKCRKKGNEEVCQSKNCIECQNKIREQDIIKRKLAKAVLYDAAMNLKSQNITSSNSELWTRTNKFKILSHPMYRNI